ncbi:MAG: hypothetical protein US89_C0001G0018 [Candidatus Peregrinibacteria bacterium GW2011_GWF2_38_29]|nr:MAG: hypothetical protein US89_C0001G0018 [Candidatus Peregrinibacteria bacterium GW2011_GWF2_38_29]
MSEATSFKNIDDVTCAREMPLADLLGDKEEMSYVLGEDEAGIKIEVGIRRLKISDDDVRFSVSVKCKDPGAEQYEALPKDASIQTLINWAKSFVDGNEGIKDKVHFFTSKTAASAEAAVKPVKEAGAPAGTPAGTLDNNVELADGIQLSTLAKRKLHRLDLSEEYVMFYLIDGIVDCERFDGRGAPVKTGKFHVRYAYDDNATIADLRAKLEAGAESGSLAEASSEA